MSITTEQRKQLLEMADSYDRGGHPDIAAVMRRNAGFTLAIATHPPDSLEFDIAELETAEASYIW